MGAWGASKGAGKSYAPKGQSWGSQAAPASSWSSGGKASSWSSGGKGASTSSWSNSSSWSSGGKASSYTPAASKGYGKTAAPKGVIKIAAPTYTPSWSSGKGKDKGKSTTVYASPAKGSVFGFGMKGKDKGKGKGKKGAPPANSEYWQVKMSTENREVLGGAFTGTVASYNIKFGWGLVLPDNVEELPPQAQEKIAEANAAVEAAGKTGMNLLYFRKPDVAEGVQVEKDKACTFSVYIDDKGAGACEVVC
eukprot:TRINITY_DN130_c0_g1_i1.p1 TRINITY_DN130_c0_g1~~TRINITY_DN130_c0_g1_i1.p1  ORF type:complete len:285 (+),score=80.51 TRINITY_DN130_c0_g1_i1:107-856(+)